MSIRLTGLALALAGVLVFANAHALDDAAIDQWLGSMKDLQEWGEAQPDLDEEEFDADVDPGDLDFESMLSDSVREHREAEQIIERHGYSDVDEWSATGSRIFRAMMAAESGVSPEMEREMEQALQEIEDAPHLSDEQKAQMREQMTSQMEMLSGMFEDVPESDVEAVRRNRDAIMRVMDE
ncbi:hypothetical protein [Aquisalimonas sp.]|uniref:hypothetical protein n=1 Tax=Aquisalimonas sp. TaxID=1872621 RepID=UPI0025C0711F|nr:hypothetical protein [Aquisalimonas sp.]